MGGLSENFEGGDDFGRVWAVEKGKNSPNLGLSYGSFRKGLL